jgi:hypothetical protein
MAETTEERLRREHELRLIEAYKALSKSPPELEDAFASADAAYAALRAEIQRPLRAYMEGAYVTVRDFSVDRARCGCPSAPIMHGDYQVGARVTHEPPCPLHPEGGV